jgi:hypothetical protein
VVRLFLSTSTNTVKVSLDPATKKPVPVNPLLTSTPEEKLLFQRGEANYNLKKAESKMALRKQTPTNEEHDLIHALWLRQSERPSDYHGTSSDTLSCPPSNTARYRHPPPQAQQSDLDGFHQDPKCRHHAATIPEPAQLHDLRRLPFKIHLRARLHLRLGLLAYSPDVHRTRPLDLRESRTRRLRAISDRHRSVHGLASRARRQSR